MLSKAQRLALQATSGLIKSEPLCLVCRCTKDDLKQNLINQQLENVMDVSHVLKNITVCLNFVSYDLLLYLFHGLFQTDNWLLRHEHL